MGTRWTSASLLLVLLASPGAFSGASPSAEADVILVNGRIVTLDEAHPGAEAIAVRGERIERVGSNREVRALAGPDTQVLDLGGRTVVPGFNDAHLHFESGGFYLLQVDLRGATTYEEIARRVRAYADSLPPGPWVLGRGWDHTLLPGGEWPTREILDRIVPDRPAYLRRVCGHAGWANSKALDAAGITRDTPDPPGGEIARDDRGEPTGILKEEACRLISDILPPRTPEERLRAITLALHEAARLGVTSVQEMGTSPEALRTYRELQDGNRLTVRIAASPPLEKALALLPAVGLTTGFGDSWLRVGALKDYADGALGAATAALLEPYADQPASTGILVLTEEEIHRRVRVAHEAGCQVAFHAIGDRANRIVLDAIEAALLAFPRENTRHRIEHAQVLSPEDLPRFARLGAVASMQPTHCTSDLRWAEDRLGPDRARGAYAWRSLLDSGAHLAFGTDWPIEGLDPLAGLYAAVTRCDREGFPEGGWHPEQRITLEEALAAYTLGSAYASFEEDLKGSIEVGKLADLVVLSEPILDVPPEKLLTTEVLMTMVGGRVVYEK